MKFDKQQSLSRREMLKLGSGLLAGAALPDALTPLARPAAQAGLKHLYLGNDDHTDYYWKGTEADYLGTPTTNGVFVNLLDYHLNLIDTTANEPPEHQNRFNCDGHLWVWAYERKKSPADLNRLINRIRDGHISVPLNALCLCLGGVPAEGVLRGMYYAGTLERRFNLDITLVSIVENQTLPYGLGALWAGAGAKYSWRGICGCQSKVHLNANVKRDNQMYWWNNIDGSRILMKWYSFDGLQTLGGYSEAYNPPDAINRMDAMINNPTEYPYFVAGAFGYGWDHLQRPPVHDFVAIAKANTNASRKVYVSNEIDFFQRFESTYGGILPGQALAFGNDWELFNVTLVEVTASVLRAIEQLRSAEALATLVSLKNPTFMNGREAERDQTWMNLGLYFEHNWVGNGDIPVTVRADWNRDVAGQIVGYVNDLQNDAVVALGGMIAKTGTNTRFFAFNPLSWVRTDYVDFPYSGSASVHVVDVTTGQQVPSQIVTIDGTRYIRVWAENVPSVGYKVFEIRSGAGTTFTGGPTANAGTLDNGIYQVTVNTLGAITSIIDHTRADRQFTRPGFLMNHLGGSGSGSPLQVQNAGPVSITLTATASSPRNHTSSITLFRNSYRIDIRNRITQNFSETLFWDFNFNLSAPDVMHEEVGAIIRAKTQANGGQYGNLNTTRYDGFTIGHFADMSGTGNIGMTLSTLDLQYMKVGNGNAENLDITNPVIHVWAGGLPNGAGLGLPNQDGDSQFLQRFALQSHDAYNQVAAMKFGMEHQNPLVAGLVTGGSQYPATQFSLVNATNPNIFLWAIKPADDGMDDGIITRWWNIASASQSLSFSMPNSPITSAQRVSHIETPIGSASVSGGTLTANLTAQQMTTYLLKTGSGTPLPGVPQLNAPPDETEVATAQPILSWNAAANATRYEFQLVSGSAPDDGDPVIPTTALSYTPPSPLLVGQTYFWRARAANSAGNLSAWSAAWQFSVASSPNAAPSRNYYNTARPTLRWAAISWALGYQVEIAQTAAFASPVVGNVGANQLSFTPAQNLAEGTWYWHVRAKRTSNPDTWGNWSAPEQFVVELP